MGRRRVQQQLRVMPRRVVDLGELLMFLLLRRLTAEEVIFVVFLVVHNVLHLHYGLHASERLLSFLILRELPRGLAHGLLISAFLDGLQTFQITGCLNHIIKLKIAYSFQIVDLERGGNADVGAFNHLLRGLQLLCFLLLFRLFVRHDLHGLAASLASLLFCIGVLRLFSKKRGLERVAMYPRLVPREGQVRGVPGVAAVVFDIGRGHKCETLIVDRSRHCFSIFFGLLPVSLGFQLYLQFGLWAEGFDAKQKRRSLLGLKDFRFVDDYVQHGVVANGAVHEGDVDRCGQAPIYRGQLIF